MKLVADLHIHTIASQHAYSTITEICAHAKAIGLTYVGITDHAPAMLDAPKEYYFMNLRILPRIINDVQVLRGVELNILDDKGMIDLKSHILKSLDFAIASYHPGIIPYYYTAEQFTEGYLQVLDNDKVKILGHIDNPKIPFDMEQVLLKAKEKNVLIEINDSSYGYIRPGSREVGLEMLKIAKKIGNYIIINSDAHTHQDVGICKKAMQLAKDTAYPLDLIVNTDLQLFQRFFSDV